jgi:uncharacterized protein involved in cysteine biosynthesis
MNSTNQPANAGSSGISLLTGFARGFAAPLDGLLFMRKHPALWQYGLVPMVINLILSGIVMLAAAYGVWYAAGQLEGMFPEGWLGQVGYYASLIGLVLLAVMLALAFRILMQGLLCGVYYEKLTRRIEETLDSGTSQFDDLPFTRGMLDAARDAASLVTITVGLQFLHIIPVLGSIAALGLTLYFDWFILGREYFDYPLSLRGLDRAEKNVRKIASRPHTRTRRSRDDPDGSSHPRGRPADIGRHRRGVVASTTDRGRSRQVSHQASKTRRQEGRRLAAKRCRNGGVPCSHAVGE